MPLSCSKDDSRRKGSEERANPAAQKVSSRQFGEEGGERVGGELGAMESGLFQTAERFRNLRGGDAAGAIERFAREKFGQDGRAGKRSNAALGFEARFGNDSRINARREAKDISADGICHLNDGGRIRQIAGIARIFEMVEDGRRVHRKKVYS